jgi:putative endonuclease
MLRMHLYVYILECSDDSFYVGVTNNVGRRFIEHFTGMHEEAYTFKRRPLKLVFCREFNNPLDAINFEKQLKRWSRSKKLALINSDFETLHDLAECKNETHFRNYQNNPLTNNELIKASKSV